MRFFDAMERTRAAITGQRRRSEHTWPLIYAVRGQSEDPPSVPVRVRAPVQKHRLAWTLSATLVAAIVVGIGAMERERRTVRHDSSDSVSRATVRASSEDGARLTKASSRTDLVSIAEPAAPPLPVPRSDLSNVPAAKPSAVITEDAPSAESESGHTPFEVSPILLKKVEPEYPDAALRAGVEGVVVVTYGLDASGRPRDMKVTSSPSILDEATLSALNQWRYSVGPGTDLTQKYRFSAEFSLR